MTTEDGRTLALSDLRGKVVVLTFIYTRCPLPDFCPLMDRKFAALAAALEAFPERARARPADLAQLRPRARHARGAEEARPDPGGAAAALDVRRRPPRRAGQDRPRLGLTYGPTATEIMHNLSTAVIDPEGKLAALLVGSGASVDAPELLKEIYPLVKAADKRRNVPGPTRKMQDWRAEPFVRRSQCLGQVAASVARSFFQDDHGRNKGRCRAATPSRSWRRS